jgi:diguanylate cyclase (GGDEF)-like protein
MFGVFLTLCLLGTCLLVGSIPPLLSILRLLPHGMLRRIWATLAVLVGFFIAGYVGVIWLRWDTSPTHTDLIVAVVFCTGGLFVLCVTNLARRTMIDVRRLASLERDAVVDPLTGLYNRRFLMRRLEDEVARARRQGLPLSVLMIDIDRFKEINDTAGHGHGDKVLRSVARLVAGNCRGGEVAVRYGGDEILVLATNTAAGSAERLAERLRHAIATTNFGKDCEIMVSIGVAALAEGNQTATELLACADEALYAAKHAGRNRTRVAAAVRCPSRRLRGIDVVAGDIREECLDVLG